MKPIFVHSAVDDAGLIPSEFRVYAHVARRAGDGDAFPSVHSIAKACRINKETAKAALDQLCARGMIRRQYRDGFSNLYRIADLSEWTTPPGKEGCPLQTKGEENSTYLPPENDALLPQESGGAHPPEKKGDEGTPLKVIQEGDPKKVIQSDASIPIYEAYPRKQGRKDALKAITKALEAVNAEHLLARTKAYAEAVALWRDNDRQFVPHPATWFNRGSYDDDPTTWIRVYGGPVPWQRKTNEVDHSNGFWGTDTTETAPAPAPTAWTWEKCVEAIGKDVWRLWITRNGPITKREDMQDMRSAILHHLEQGGSIDRITSEFRSGASARAVAHLCAALGRG